MPWPKFRRWFVPEKELKLEERVSNIERVFYELLNYLKVDVVMGDPFDKESFVDLRKRIKGEKNDR